MNILLYENRNGPDMELMQATSTRGAVASMTSHGSDDEEDHRKNSTSARENQERNQLGRIRSTKQN